MANIYLKSSTSQNPDKYQGRFGRRILSPVLVTVALLAFVIVNIILTQPADARIRIKDITSIEGIRDNLLIGYGLVVGLNGTGDDLGNSVFTRESLVGMLERLGVKADGAALNTQNTAAVIVTASLPPFSRQGSRIDITVSALGDASSLEGGTLLVTPLQAADGEIYALAQGNVTAGGFNVQGQAQTVSRGVTTSGRLPSGAIIEREIPFALNDLQSANISLNNPDASTALRIAEAINGYIQSPVAVMLDPTTIRLSSQDIPLAHLIARIEQLEVDVDQKARVIIDESSGVIVMGGNVRISNVAVAQGNLSVSISETPIVSQPNPFSNGGETVVVPRTEIIIDEEADRQLAVVPEAVTLQELVNGLNALGVSPRDLISILHAIKAAGALQAEIGTM